MPYEQMTEDELRQLAKEMILGLTEKQCRELLTEKELAESKAG